jgi:uncharacterized protein YfdQ (DUF2303 family)
VTEKNIAETIIEVSSKPEVFDFLGMPMLAVPPGWVAEKNPALLERPLALVAHPVFSKTVSLLDYVDNLSDDEIKKRIFANDSKFIVTVVLDPYSAEKTSHQNHTANLKFSRSPEWILWKTISKEWMTPTKFIRFVENNLEYIAGDFAGAKVLDMCRALNIKHGGETTIDTIGSGAERAIQFTQDSNATGMGIAFPEQLEINLRIFKNCAEFKFKPRLRVHVEGQNSVQFSIDLMDADIIEENAFGHEVGAVQEGLGEAILYGSM